MDINRLFCDFIDERENLLKEIDKEWASHLQKPIEDDIFEDVDECIIKVREHESMHVTKGSATIDDVFFGCCFGFAGKNDAVELFLPNSSQHDANALRKYGRPRGATVGENRRRILDARVRT